MKNMLKIKENEDKKFFQKEPSSIHLKYPHPLQKDFQKKIALKKEFQFKYDGTIRDIIEEDKNGKLCTSDTFVISAHQKFVKEYLGPQTPYNGLLLYHGMGSGKTCSAIGITEEYRKTNKYNPAKNKIIIIASPNVQDNFKLQLFDKEKLKKVNKLWALDGCNGSTLLDELKNLELENLSKDQISRRIEKIISDNYVFMGYEKFANKIENILSKINVTDENVRINRVKKALNAHFDNSLIVIDEVHNIRLSQDSENKKVANALLKMVQVVDNLKLLFLSGTPMYNDPTEIVFLINLLRINDNRELMYTKQIFDKKGNVKNEDYLKEKCNGYVSYVRGENPYNFPFKVYPNDYGSLQSIKKMGYPQKQFNQKQITKPLQNLDIFMNELTSVQREGYKLFIQELYQELTPEQYEKFEEMDSFGYTYLQTPLNLLNICYKIKDSTDDSVRYVSGKEGINEVMKHEESGKDNKRYNYEYIQDEKIFKYDKIGHYSSKIKAILDIILKSKGTVLVYSQYIDAGLLPLALALEELGFSRAKHNNLLKPRTDIPKLNSLTMTPEKDENGLFKQCKYSMITGNVLHSPKGTNLKELKLINSSDNTEGNECKVVLISQAGSEGLDFKNLRQVHILEPWYNLNRIEQIIGRAIRNCSHKKLPLEKRNTQIFLHGSYIQDSQEECVDLMIYRYAEKKAKLIGSVQRILKSVSVDCLLNIEQNNFSKFLNQTIPIVLSTGDEVKFEVRDKPNTSLCDYLETCEYTCDSSLGTKDKINSSSFSYDHLLNQRISQNIKRLFIKQFRYSIKEIHEQMKEPNIQPEVIEHSIINLIKNKELVIDKYLRKGFLKGVNDYVVFQPIELDNEYISYRNTTTVLNTDVLTLNYTVKDNKSPGINSDKQNNIEILGNKTTNNTKQTNVTTVKSSKLLQLVENIKINISRALIDKSGSSYDSSDIFECFYPMVNKVNDIIDDIQIDKNEAYEMILQYIMETLKREDERLLLQYLFTNKNSLDKDETGMFNYLKKRIVSIDNTKLFITVDIDKYEEGKRNVVIYSINDTGSFTTVSKATKIEIEMFGGLNTLIEKIKTIRKERLFKYSTFFSFSKKNQTVEIKVKDNSLKRVSHGAFFEDKPPGKMMPILNEIVGEEVFQNTSKKIGKKGKNNKFSKVEWCLLLFIITRIYSKNEKQSKTYFLDKVEYEIL